MNVLRPEVFFPHIELERKKQGKIKRLDNLHEESFFFLWRI